jgi:hypothetical protein
MGLFYDFVAQNVRKICCF